jgi:hypothetical protein
MHGDTVGFLWFDLDDRSDVIGHVVCKDCVGTENDMCPIANPMPLEHALLSDVEVQFACSGCGEHGMCKLPTGHTIETWDTLHAWG